MKVIYFYDDQKKHQKKLQKIAARKDTCALIVSLTVSIAFYIVFGAAF